MDKVRRAWAGVNKKNKVIWEVRREKERNGLADRETL